MHDYDAECVIFVHSMQSVSKLSLVDCVSADRWKNFLKLGISFLVLIWFDLGRNRLRRNPCPHALTTPILRILKFLF